MSAQATLSPRKKDRYRLLDGFHIDVDPDRPAVVKDGVVIHPQGEKTFEKGDIIETTVDLLTVCNKPGFRPKFERIPDHDNVVPSGAFVFDQTKETLEQFVARVNAGSTITVGNLSIKSEPETDTLDKMSVEQLRKHAEEEEIDVKNAKTKEQLLAAIRNAK